MTRVWSRADVVVKQKAKLLSARLSLAFCDNGSAQRKKHKRNNKTFDGATAQ